MSRTKEKVEKITKSTLLSRGWTPAGIDVLLPEPELVRNPHYKSAAPMQLWVKDLVLEKEQSEEFTKLQSKKKRNKINYERIESISEVQGIFDELSKKCSGIRKSYANFKTYDKRLCELGNFLNRKKISKTLGIDSSDEEKQLSELKKDVKDTFVRLRKKFVLMYAEMYADDPGITGSIERILNDSKYDYLVSIQDIATSCIIQNLLPTAPKDEYPAARAMKRRFIVHTGPTNTGKTYNALLRLKEALCGVYLAPLRLLALEIFSELNNSGVPCNLSTGEEDIIVPSSHHISSTIEKLNTEDRYDVAVIDEAQLLTDEQRGSAWTRAILGVLSDEVHVCCSPNAVNIIKQLINDCGDSCEVVEYEWNTPLLAETKAFSFPKSVSKGDALVVFSRRSVLQVSGELVNRGLKVSAIYGALPPDVRRKQVERFLSGETDVVVATDAIGMGLNLPIRRIVFLETRKFDGKSVRQLVAAEVKQVAGRAGRFGIYDVGYVNSSSDKKAIKKMLNAKLDDLEYVYYAPPRDFVLSIKIGDLKQRLLACTESRDKSEGPFKKADLNNSFVLYDALQKQYGNNGLEEFEMYSLMFIPFDVENHDLLAMWRRLVTNYVNKVEPKIPKQTKSDDLRQLELRYDELDLYFCFCKTMNIPFDEESIMELKYDVSERINRILKSGLKRMRRKCKHCGKLLPWNHQYGMCEACYSSMHRYDDYGDYY